MELQPDQSAPGGRRYTVGPPPTDQDMPIYSNPMEGAVGLRPQETALLPLPNHEQGHPDRILTEPSNQLEPQTPDEEPDTGNPMHETQQLFLWSAAPNVLGVNSVAGSAGGDPRRQAKAASPSEALLHSLGDGGLRSAMRPPGFLSQSDWLRHQLLQAIEDAQLLFSSLWDECTCSTLGLPSKTCPSNQSVDVLDPAIAFAACTPGAPKRRLQRGEAPPEANAANAAAFHGAQASRPREVQSEFENEGHRAETEHQGAGEEETNRKAPTPPTARQYISAAMSWATRQLEDPRLFPPSPTSGQSGGAELLTENDNGEALRSVASLMARRLLRCYAHIYLWHLPLLQQHGAVAHANRCLKRLMFLAVDAQLLDGNEGPLEPIRSLADAWLQEDQTQASDSTAQDAQMQPHALGAQQSDEAAPDDWLVPALVKAEKCLGVLDKEEYPFFGAEENR